LRLSRLELRTVSRFSARAALLSAAAYPFSAKNCYFSLCGSAWQAVSFVPSPAVTTSFRPRSAKRSLFMGRWPWHVNDLPITEFFTLARYPAGFCDGVWLALYLFFPTE